MIFIQRCNANDHKPGNGKGASCGVRKQDQRYRRKSTETQEGVKEEESALDWGCQ